jgi:hypothetical protein
VTGRLVGIRVAEVFFDDRFSGQSTGYSGDMLAGVISTTLLIVVVVIAVIIGTIVWAIRKIL